MQNVGLQISLDLEFLEIYWDGFVRYTMNLQKMEKLALCKKIGEDRQRSLQAALAARIEENKKKRMDRLNSYLLGLGRPGPSELTFFDEEKSTTVRFASFNEAETKFRLSLFLPLRSGFESLSRHIGYTRIPSEIFNEENRLFRVLNRIMESFSRRLVRGVEKDKVIFLLVETEDDRNGTFHRPTQTSFFLPENKKRVSLEYLTYSKLQMGATETELYDPTLKTNFFQTLRKYKEEVEIYVVEGIDSIHTQEKGRDAILFLLYTSFYL